MQMARLASRTWSQHYTRLYDGIDGVITEITVITAQPRWAKTISTANIAVVASHSDRTESPRALRAALQFSEGGTREKTIDVMSHCNSLTIMHVLIHSTKLPPLSCPTQECVYFLACYRYILHGFPTLFGASISPWMQQ